MALSMDEQRILDEIERALASADPRLATRMSSFGTRGLLTVRMRRIRLLASLGTLLVVAAVSLVVYALVPFRTAAERQGAGQDRCLARGARGDGPVPRHRPAVGPGQRRGQPGQLRPGGQDLSLPGPGVGQPAGVRPGRRQAVGHDRCSAADRAIALGPAQYSRQICSRYCSSPSRFFLACWNSSLSGSTPRSNSSS